MYHAKAARQGRRVRDQGSDDPARDLEIAAALHHAIARGQLVLEYQPIVDLDTGAIQNVEALVRWDRGRRARHARACSCPQPSAPAC